MEEIRIEEQFNNNVPESRAGVICGFGCGALSGYSCGTGCDGADGSACGWGC